MKKLTPILSITLFLASCYPVPPIEWPHQPPVIEQSKKDSGWYGAFRFTDSVNVFHNSIKREVMWQHLSVGIWKASFQDVQFQEIEVISVSLENRTQNVSVENYTEEGCVFIKALKNGERVDELDINITFFLIWKNY